MKPGFAGLRVPDTVRPPEAVGRRSLPGDVAGAGGTVERVEGGIYLSHALTDTMVVETLTEVLLGIYIGLLAGIFPSFIAFSIGFGFKYFTNVTVPGLGVVVLGGALAGVSGGLMGLVDPNLTETWTGVTAILVILMACLWAHAQGDKLGAETPRRLTLKRLRETRLSTDLVDRVDSYGQIRIQPLGEIQDIEGYPPLPDDLRSELRAGSWRFPAGLSLAELESRLEQRLTDDHELAEVSVTIDRNGRAEISAAPTTAGLSRRVPPGKRAVSVKTLLPTGLARGDVVTLELPDGEVSGPVLSARTTGAELPKVTAPAAADGDNDAELAPPKAPTTTGGEGQVTVALAYDEARRVLRSESAPLVVHSRGKQREYEAIGVLTAGGNRFRKLTLGAESPLADRTIGASQIRDAYSVAILAIRRGTERIVTPRGDTQLLAGDRLIVVGTATNLREFEEVVA